MIKDVHKVGEVIGSCKTYKQLEVARKYVERVIMVYRSVIPESVCTALVEKLDNKGEEIFRSTPKVNYRYC